MKIPEHEHRHSYIQENLLIMVGLFAIIILITIGTNDKISALEQKYVFTEDECVLRIPVESCSLDEEWRCRSCQVYCHTTQIQDGEECEIDLDYYQASQYNIYEWINFVTEPCDKFCRKMYEENKINAIEIAKCMDDCEFEKAKKVCTPTYKTITTFCATADEINEVLE